MFRICYNELVATNPAELDLPVAKYTDDQKLWGGVITSGGFLPRIQLMGGNSEAVKEGKVQIGTYSMIKSKDNMVDLTKEFDCTPLVWRFKALRIKEGNVYNFYNPQHSEFRKIQEEAKTPNSGSLFGAEFLLWMPTQECFATFFFSSKTSRRQAPNLRAILEAKQNATFKVELIKSKKFTWHGPIVMNCSTPITAFPDREDLLAESEKFANPQDSEVEKADEVGASGREQ